MSNIRPVLRATIDAAIIKYFDRLPFDVVAAIKTEAYYLRVLERGVRDLYNGRITEDDLLTTMTRLLDEQFRRAFNEGMRENDLDPARDMTPEWEAALQSWIDDEFNFVEGFINDVARAAQDKTSIDPLLYRAGLWAMRYNEIKSRAQVLTAPKDLNFQWNYGDTIDHCETCAALAGVVATAAEWAALQARGIYPQSFQLECHGFNCQCHLDATDEPVTPGGIPSV